MNTEHFSVRTWKEGQWFVSWCPEIDVSSMVATRSKARKNLDEAIEIFQETSAPQLKRIIAAGRRAYQEGRFIPYDKIRRDLKLV